MMGFRRRDLVFFVLFGLIALTAGMWLILGSAPLLASISASIHDDFHRQGQGQGLIAQLARNAAQASHATGSSSQAFFDYGFSLFNLGLGIFLIKLRPLDITARLLSIGMVGTAIAFNLQGHDALQVVPVASLGVVDQWHFWVHVASGLCYMFALLLFPSGRPPGDGQQAHVLRIPLLVILALFFTMLSSMTVDDHTLGLVLVFGIFIPVTGVTAQIGRYRKEPNQEQRQQSKLLLWALLFALAIAIPLVFITRTPPGLGSQKTLQYEFTAPSPGTYFFRCDPHPEDMIGRVVVAEAVEGSANSQALAVDAKDSEFDTDILELTAGQPTTINFTNRDSDLHNVAIYLNDDASEPIFIGAEFSGQETAAFTFRVFRIIFIVIPIALFIGLIRFRLWDIDRVINRTLVYGALASFITLVYLGVVVGIGTAIGAGRRLNLFLSIGVTALLAWAFQPLRERARKLANRLVYGHRATPYEVLAQLSERVGSAYDLEDVIPEMARAIAEGTAAERASIWLRVDDRLVLSASWPDDIEPSAVPIQMDDRVLPTFEGVDHAVGVRHREETLGALTVTKPPGESLTPVEERLLEDIAAQAGLVLRNAQLTAELEGRLQQLRESRQRIVTAQDVERRRLERNIHDGAQQHLVALSMKLRRAQGLVERDPEGASALLEELQDDTGDALQTLRDLARGIYPPVLADKGLVQALEAHARRCPIAVSVSGDGVGRHPAEVETAVYFCCLEAIQNSIKHAGAGKVSVTLRASDVGLHFSVRDEGPGFDKTAAPTGAGLQNMNDRMAALSGTVEVISAIGAPTVVRGWVPTGTTTPPSTKGRSAGG